MHHIFHSKNEILIPERKRKILELFSEGQGASAIARIVGGTESSVRQVRDADKKKKAAQDGSGNRWYESITDKNLEELIDAARTEIPNCNTEIADTVTVLLMRLIGTLNGRLISKHYSRQEFLGPAHVPFF